MCTAGCVAANAYCNTPGQCRCNTGYTGDVTPNSINLTLMVDDRCDVCASHLPRRLCVRQLHHARPVQLQQRLLWCVLADHRPSCVERIVRQAPSVTRLSAPAPACRAHAPLPTRARARRDGLGLHQYSNILACFHLKQCHVQHGDHQTGLCERQLWRHPLRMCVLCWMDQ